METKMIEVCEAVLIDVTCAHNDSVDIKAGGPLTLGYEFYVISANIDKLKIVIKAWLKKYRRKFLYIQVRTKSEFPVKNLWTPEMIENCIKENEVV